MVRAAARRVRLAGGPEILPAIFPLEVRAAGSGLAYNFGRFVTAAGVLAARGLFAALGGDYVRIGTVTSLVYALGAAAI